MQGSFAPNRWADVDVIDVRPATLRQGADSSDWLCGRCGDAYPLRDSVAVRLRTHLGTTDEIVCPTCAAIAQRLRAGIRPTRVLLVEDDAGFRDIVRRHIELDGAAEIVGYADDGVQALTETHWLEPDLVVLDLAMPRRGGLDVLEQLSAEIRVVVLTEREDLAERCRQIRPDVTILPKSPRVFRQLTELIAGTRHRQ